MGRKLVGLPARPFHPPCLGPWLNAREERRREKKKEGGKKEKKENKKGEKDKRVQKDRS